MLGYANVFGSGRDAKVDRDGYGCATGMPSEAATAGTVAGLLWVNDFGGCRGVAWLRYEEGSHPVWRHRHGSDGQDGATAESPDSGLRVRALVPGVSARVP